MHLDLIILLAIMIVLLPLAASAVGVKPTSAEMARAHDWAAARFGSARQAATAVRPFSFVYGDRPSSEFIATWKTKRTSRKLDKARTEITNTYTDPATALVVTCRAIEYRDFPTIEWTLLFENTGKIDTPIISDVRPLDVNLTRTKVDEFQLHWNTAENCTQDSYGPHTDPLTPDTVKQFASEGGRPTTGNYPYYNIEMDGGGTIVVLSWAGQWSSEFKRDSGKGLHIRGGQELTHFTLHPGEKVSSPLAIVQFYDGDWIRGQNIWRRWMIAYCLPKVDGKAVSPFTYGADGEFSPGMRTNLDGEKASVDRFCAEGIPPVYWNQDAGWYPCDPAVGWPDVGNWEPDQTRFPGGIRALSDHLHSKGVKQMLWFEPERVNGGTWLAKNHPEWIHGGANGGLLNLGNPDCWQWVVEHFDNLITTQGVDCYRQDSNIAPLDYWRGADTEDRQGITEIKHIEGYYAYWDELRRRHPKLLIDTCASGGRRNNVETLRRSVPVLRSDYTVEPIGQQGHTYGLSMWVPFYGTGQYPTSAYDMRSSMCPIFGIGGDVRKPDLNWDLSRASAKEWSVLSKCMLGDYYPLTPYSLEKTTWIAWQFDLPESNMGAVVAFRRDENTDESQVYKIRGLDPKATYTIEDLNSSTSTKITGAKLMNDGLRVNITIKPGSALYIYHKTS